MTGNCIHCQAPIEPHFKACPICGETITAFVRQSMEAPIDGKYRILSRLGRGGMGEVYKVLHVHLNTVRVIKLMHPEIAGEAEAHERFVREARLATKINHPNVATLHDFAALPDGAFYMVWEYIEGKSLAQLIRQRGRVSPRYTALIAIQALHGLDAIHRAGIVHRDVSPDNIMLAVDEHGEERVKIIDLGIAKGVTDAIGQKTQTGMFVGKWRYCSPEHLGLLPAGERIDGRADLYSFGIVLYEMLTGTPPFVAEGPQQYYMQHARETPKPFRIANPAIDTAPELEQVIFRALEKDRDKRFANAREFADALQTILPQLADESGEQQATISLPLASTTQPLTPIPAPPTVRTSPAAATTRTPSPTQASVAPTMRTPQAAMQIPEPTMRTPQAAAPIPAAPTLVEAPRRSIALPIALGVIFLLLVAGGVAVFMMQRRSAPVVVETASSAPSPATQSVIPAQVLPATTGTVASTTVDVVQAAPETVTETIAPTVTEPEKAKPPVVVKPAARPKPVPPPVVETAEPAAEPEPAPAEPQRVAKTGRRGGPGTFSDSPEYNDGSFRSGVIPDYDVLTKSRGVNWIWVAPGFRFASHKYRIGSFRNVTAYDSPQLHTHLESDLQEQVNGVTEEATGDTVTTEGAIIWTETARNKKRGVGVEIVFRDSKRRIVAMIRHVERESSPEAAAEEVVEAITGYIEEN